MTAALLAPPGPDVQRGPTRSRVDLRTAVGQSLAIARRNLIQIKHDPSQLLDATLMPMVFTLVFVYVFGGAIGKGQADYRQYLIPGIMVQTVSFAAQVTGTALNLDFSKGVMDRFRSMPIARSAVLSGRILADVCGWPSGRPSSSPSPSSSDSASAPMWRAYSPPSVCWCSTESPCRPSPRISVW